MTAGRSECSMWQSSRRQSLCCTAFRRSRKRPVAQTSIWRLAATRIYGRSYDMSNERFANVWDAIEDTPAQAENMRLRASLMLALRDHIEREGLSQSQAAKLLAVTQPRISDLIRGKIDLFAIDTLVNMLASAGLGVEMRIGTAPT